MKKTHYPDAPTARTKCKHENKNITKHAGLLRVVCPMCNQVTVDFMDLADTGVLFRVPRLG